MKQPRVLIVNKFYYRRGGDCVCTINLERLLRARGHDVAVFAMRYPLNEPSPWESYWPPEVDFGGGPADKLAAVRRTLGLGDVRRCFARMLGDFRPDVVHLNNIHSYLSPVVGALARHAGIPVVWTLHDYKLICPSYLCLRSGRVCEECFASAGARKSRLIATRCMKGSLAASAVAYVEARRWSAPRLSRFTSRFICPSDFMARKMEQGGYDPAKLVTLCNFIDPDMERAYRQLLDSGTLSRMREPYYCYVGRLSAEKGVATLLEAASRLPYELRVAGDGPLAAELRSRYASARNIRFLGRLDGHGVRSLLASARLSVMPSECYENNPLGVIESLCAGTPVVGASIGGIPELLDHASGLLFDSGSASGLTHALGRAWNTAYDHAAIAVASLQRFSAAAHYTSLADIYRAAFGN